MSAASSSGSHCSTACGDTNYGGMLPTDPVVSVILPTYNRSKLLVRALDSVLAQTYADLECIVVDDASSDDTPAVVAEVARRDPRVRYVRHDTNRFPGAARNTGTRLARGPLIAHHDDDDEWLPTKLEKQVALIQSLPPEYGCVYCWADYVGPGGQLIRQHRPTVRGDAYARTLVSNGIGCTPSLLVRREAADRAGPWNETLRTQVDDEWIIRLCRACKVDFVPEALVRVHAGHPGPRASSPGAGEEGLARTIAAIEARYDLFQKDRRLYRAQAAAIEALLGNLRLRAGDRRGGLQHFREAFALAPLSWEPWHMLLSLAKWYVRGGAFRRAR